MSNEKPSDPTPALESVEPAAEPTKKLTPGEKLQAWRKKHQWSQHRLAIETGIPATTISKYECDVFYPERDNARRIARATADEIPSSNWDVDPDADAVSAAS